MILELLLKDQPPLIKALAGSLLASLPAGGLQQIDLAFESVARDLANGRDQEVAGKLRQLYAALGIDLDQYRD